MCIREFIGEAATLGRAGLRFASSKWESRDYVKADEKGVGKRERSCVISKSSEGG